MRVELDNYLENEFLLRKKRMNSMCGVLQLSEQLYRKKKNNKKYF